MKEFIMGIHLGDEALSCAIVVVFVVFMVLHSGLGKKLQNGDYKSIWGYRCGYLTYTMMSLVLVFIVFLGADVFYTWLFVPVQLAWQVVGLFLAVVLSALDLHLMMKKVSWARVGE